MKNVIFYFLFTMMLFHGLPASAGGLQKTESRVVSAFSEINVSSALKLVITQSDDYSLKLEGDEDILRLVEIKQKGEVLNIGLKESFQGNLNEPLTVYVSCRELKALRVSGACSVETANQLKTSDLKIISNGAGKLDLDIHVAKLEATLNGASLVTVKGKCDKSTLIVSGASNLEAGELIENDVVLECTGASKVFVNATRSLDIHASGASSVKYSGTATVKTESKGVSSIKKV